MTKSTLGGWDPTAHLGAEPEQPPKPKEQPKRKKAPKEPKGSKQEEGPKPDKGNTLQGKKSRCTVQMSKALQERARNAVYHEPGLTLSGLVEKALAAEIDRLEKRRGEAYPKRSGAIPTGRPIK